MLTKTLVLLFILKPNRASIAGVTYMNDFDFEQRYRNLHECDPFYWHPLHLPEECADMFAKLIRSKINTPYTIMQEREPTFTLNELYNHVRAEMPYSNRHDDIKYGLRVHYGSFESYDRNRNIDYDTVPVEAQILELYQSRPRTPMDKLFELMRRDVKDNPSAPKITSIPYFGGVALYRQPVSYKTEAMIKRLSGAYAKAAYQP
ncbi:unnamed protein product [Colias eurytheme]|nr:unnamed protein product [Colias eurytheme]